MTSKRTLTPQGRQALIQRLGSMLSQRPEIIFACAHGSFVELESTFRDIDIAVWLETGFISRDAELSYQWDLSSWLEKDVPHAIDVQILNHSSLGFRYAASGGLLLCSRDPVFWYDFREETWEHYLDFAPLAQLMLIDILGSRTE